MSESKAYSKPKKITITLDKSTANVEVFSNENEIISQFQEVLEIQSKKENKKKRRFRDHLDMKLFDNCPMTQVDKIP